MACITLSACALLNRDTPVLCESLTYSQGLPEVLEGTPLSATRPNTTVYSPPFDEFEVVHVSMPATTSTQTPLGLQEHLPASPVRTLAPPQDVWLDTLSGTMPAQLDGRGTAALLSQQSLACQAPGWVLSMHASARAGQRLMAVWGVQAAAGLCAR